MVRLSLSKPPRRVFIDSPGSPVNLGLKHPPRPHVRSGWLDEIAAVWIYTVKYLQASGMEPVQVDDVGPVRDVCSLSADWKWVNAAAASFISPFSHLLFSYLCWTHVTWASSSAPPQCTSHGRCAYAAPHPHEVAIKINIPQTILDSKESLWSELRKVQENISAQLWGTILTQAPASYSEQLSAYFFLAVLSNKVVFCLWSIFSDLWGIRSQSVSYQPWKYSLSKELHILLLTLTVEAFFFFFSLSALS